MNNLAISSVNSFSSNVLDTSQISSLCNTSNNKLQNTVSVISEITFDPSKPSFLLDLPTELIVTIISHVGESHLHKLARICKKFREIVLKLPNQYNKIFSPNPYALLTNERPRNTFLRRNGRFIYDDRTYFDLALANYSQSRVTSSAVERFLTVYGDNIIKKADCNEILREACVKGDKEFVGRLLMNSKIDPTAENNEAFLCAVEEEHIEIVDLFLKDGRVNPTADDNKAFFLACDRGYLKIVKLFLKDGRVDPSAHWLRAFYLVIKHNHFNIFKLLLKDCRVDLVTKNEVLINACKLGDTRAISILLSYGKVVLSVDFNRLLEASELCEDEAKKTRTIELINTYKCKMSSNSIMSINSPIWKGNRISVLKMFINDLKFDPCERNNLLLITACKQGRIKVVKFLLSDLRICSTIDYSRLANTAKFCKYKKNRIVMMSLINQHKDKIKQLQRNNSQPSKKRKNESLQNDSENVSIKKRKV